MVIKKRFSFLLTASVLAIFMAACGQGPSLANSKIETTPAPSRRQPEPSSGQPEPVQGQPEPPSEQPEPVQGQPEPPSEQPEPVQGQPEPPSEQPGEQPEPVQGQPEPPSEQPEPVQGQPEPPSEQPEPFREQPEPSHEQKAALQRFGARKTNTLTKAEKTQVASTLVDYLSTVKLATFIKQECSAAALRSKNCKVEREKCLKGFGNKGNEYYQSNFERYAGLAAGRLSKKLTSPDLTAQDYLSCFEAFDYKTKAIADLKCNSDQEQIIATSEDVKTKLAAKFGGPTKVKKLIDAAKDLLSLIK